MLQLIDTSGQLRIEPCCGLTVTVATIQVDELRFGTLVGLHHHMLFKGHRTMLGHDKPGGATHRGNPRGEILDIRYRRRQSDDANGLRQMDDDFLPHRSTESVGKIMDFVKNDVLKRKQGVGMLVQHIPQHFRGHHDNIRLGVDGRVPREQPDMLGAIDCGQIMVLLVAQCLDRGGIKRLDMMLVRQVHREIRDHRLPRARRGCHKDIVPGFQGFTRLNLESVKIERQR